MSKAEIDIDEELFSEEEPLDEPVNQTPSKKSLLDPLVKEPKIDSERDEDDLLDDDLDNLDDDLGDDMGGFSADGQIAMEKHSDLLKELTSFAPYLKATVNNWLGVTWSDTEKKYVNNDCITQIMNIKGVTWCIGRLGTYARKNNIITNISSQDYRAIIMDFVKEIWMNIMTRKNEFGLTKNGDVVRVCNELQHAAELVLMGAGGGKYTNFLGSTTSYSISGKPEQNNENQQKPKSSKLKRIFGLG